VDMFFDQYLCGGGDLRSFSACRFAAVGPATAETLRRRGFIADYVPPAYNGQRLGEGLVEVSRGEPVLLIRSRQGAPALGEILTKGGVPFRELAVYDTVPAVIGGHARQAIEGGRFDYLFFTSPSAVIAFTEAFGKIFAKAVCIGEPTAEKAREYGMETAIPGEASTDAMVQLLCDLVHNREINH
jgi:uroporphyrinogen III methyltransferase/synthase